LRAGTIGNIVELPSFAGDEMKERPMSISESVYQWEEWLPKIQAAVNPQLTAT